MQTGNISVSQCVQLFGTNLTTRNKPAILKQLRNRESELNAIAQVQQYERLHSSDAFDNIADEDGNDEDIDDMNDSDDGIKGLFNFSSSSPHVKDIDRLINWQLAIGTLAAKTYRASNKRQPIPTNHFGQCHGASAAHVFTTSNKI